MASIIACEITDQPIDIDGIRLAAYDAAAGAVVCFEGVVRNHDNNAQVTGIDYSAHPDSASLLADIAHGYRDRDQIEAIGVVHRIGSLGIGDVALCVVVSGHHRQAVFGVVQEIINEIKARLPIWKKQIFADGTAAWTGLP